MPSPIRLAFVAALAALALGACSGGGGGGMTTPPVDTTDFFPIKSGPEQVARGSVRVDSEGYEVEEVPAGTTLSNLISEGLTSRNFPQFTEFQFGAATNDNGIPLQRATKTAAGRYAAVAYQAVLEHSMLLFHGGIYHFAFFEEPPESAAGRLSRVFLSTGVPTTGSPVAGTWAGKAIGMEWIRIADDGVHRPSVEVPTFAVNANQAENRIVQADVEIGVTLDGGNQNLTWAFKDWEGGSVEYPDITSGEWSTLVTEGFFAGSDHYLVSRLIGRLPTKFGSVDGNPVVEIQFYGPGRAEAGGEFAFQWEDGVLWNVLDGVFVAKKQP